MIYLESIKLPSLDEDYLDPLRYRYELSTHLSTYPFHVLSHQGLFEVQCSDIVLITGGNGTGKSTLLNVIAQKLHLKRPTPFNHSDMFDTYLQRCSCKLSPAALQRQEDVSEYGRIITSDEVFDYIIDARIQNDVIDDKRQETARRFSDLRHMAKPSGIDLEDPQSIRTYLEHAKAMKKTKARYVNDNLGFNLLERSNGENAFKFFTEAMLPKGLYLLDEPENSLSAERQMDLCSFIESMARYEQCQVIISTHSPFLMSMKGARLYNLDVYPAAVMPWTEVASVRTYYEFFKTHTDEFGKNQ